jgi:hypothetical protein
LKLVLSSYDLGESSIARGFSEFCLDGFPDFLNLAAKFGGLTSGKENIMALQKRTSPSIEKATTRAAGLASIDANLMLNSKLTLAIYKAKTDATRTILDEFNRQKSILDGWQNQLEKAEGELDKLSTAMLAGVRVNYGEDSDEYEKAGGTRTSERKPPVRTKKGT